MTLGPGKYDDLAGLARRVTSAKGVVVIVIDGELGSGFSVQATEKITAALPAILRSVAEDMETELNSRH